MADCTSVLVGNIKIISVINLGLVKRFLAVYFLFRLGELRWKHGLWAGGGWVVVLGGWRGKWGWGMIGDLGDKFIYQVIFEVDLESYIVTLESNFIKGIPLSREGEEGAVSQRFKILFGEGILIVISEGVI